MNFNARESNITEALFPVCTRLESIETFALVRPLRVDAVSVLAQVRIGSAFINVSAIIRHAHLREALRTYAHEGSNQVFARELAIICWRGALVNV